MFISQRYFRRNKFLFLQSALVEEISKYMTKKAMYYFFWKILNVKGCFLTVNFKTKLIHRKYCMSSHYIKLYSLKLRALLFVGIFCLFFETQSQPGYAGTWCGWRTLQLKSSCICMECWDETYEQACLAQDAYLTGGKIDT